jgi:hypothetical protein
MKIGSALLTASLLASVSGPARAETLNGRYDAFVEGAATCAAATGPTGVDRAIVSSAGWTGFGSAETDEMVLTAAHNRRNPFPLRINATSAAEPEHCWLSADFKADRDYAQVRRRLERRFGRAPDQVDENNMRAARWLNPGNVAELWMQPAHRLCYECPIMFFTVRPRSPEGSPTR